ncbi:MAG: SET domain-containing protein [Anaerolineales bacterium]|jgi:SET domain-containing protein
MEIFVLKKTLNKGYGLFAARDIHKGEQIFHVDLTSLRKYALEEFEKHRELDGDHADYVGRGKYVIDDSPRCYMNHCCDPNCIYRMKSIPVKDLFALRDIKAGEELTHDYTATAVDQFAGKGHWSFICQCDSEDCRRKITGDFLEMPAEWQAKYYPSLPPSIKRKYRGLFCNLCKAG